MSSSVTNSFRRRGQDHFVPEDDDPALQRRMRGYLEQIDYTTFASNKTVINQVLGHVDAAHFQHMAVAAAAARATWIAAALNMTEHSHTLTPEQVSKLAHLRASFDELAGAYEGMRRMVERGYLVYRPSPT